MSDNFVKGCLIHYTEQHIQVRKDFLDLCTYDKSQYNTGTRKSGKAKRDEPNQECMAKILRLLETLTNRKRESWHLKNEARISSKLKPLPEPLEYRIELAYSTIVRLLYSTYGESTVRNSVAALLQMGYIKRYQATKNSIPEYVLNIAYLQKCLQEHSKKQDECEVLHSTPEDSEVLNVTGEGVNSTPEPVNVTPEMLNSTPNNIGNKTDNNKDANKKERDSASRTNQQETKPTSPTPQRIFENKQKETISPAIIAIIEHWEAIEGETIPRTSKLLKAATDLAPCKPVKEDIEAVKAFCYQDNPKWFNEHPPTLQDIANNWSKWKASKKRKSNPASYGNSTSSVQRSSDFAKPAGLVDPVEMKKLMDMDPEERKKYVLERKKAREEAAQPNSTTNLAMLAARGKEQQFLQQLEGTN